MINQLNFMAINIGNKLLKTMLSKTVLLKAQKLAKLELSFLITNTKKSFFKSDLFLAKL